MNIAEVELPLMLSNKPMEIDSSPPLYVEIVRKVVFLKHIGLWDQVNRHRPSSRTIQLAVIASKQRTCISLRGLPNNPER